MLLGALIFQVRNHLLGVLMEQMEMFLAEDKPLGVLMEQMEVFLAEGLLNN